MENEPCKCGSKHVTYLMPTTMPRSAGCEECLQMFTLIETWRSAACAQAMWLPRGLWEYAPHLPPTCSEQLPKTRSPSSLTACSLTSFCLEKARLTRLQDSAFTKNQVGRESSKDTFMEASGGIPAYADGVKGKCSNSTPVASLQSNTCNY